MKLLGKLLIRMEDYRQSTQLCVPLSLQQRPEVDAGMRRASGSRIGNETGNEKVHTGPGKMVKALCPTVLLLNRRKKTPPTIGGVHELHQFCCSGSGINSICTGRLLPDAGMKPIRTVSSCAPVRYRTPASDEFFKMLPLVICTTSPFTSRAPA